MKLLRYVRNQLILTGLLCAGVYVAYEFLLDDEAKRGIKTLGSTMKSSYTTLTGIVNDRIGMVMDEDVVAQNRQQIRDAWADLGF